MLDVVLYRYDRQGRLCVRERLFESRDDLIRFFVRDEARVWAWAEVIPFDADNVSDARRVIRYSADQLRSMGGYPGRPRIGATDRLPSAEVLRN